jgi:hypothetical protein
LRLPKMKDWLITACILIVGLPVFAFLVLVAISIMDDDRMQRPPDPRPRCKPSERFK